MPVGLAVDGSASNDGSSLLEELRVCYLLHRLTSSEQAPYRLRDAEDGHPGQRPAAGPGGHRLPGGGQVRGLFLVDSRRLELVGGAESPADVLATVGLRGPVD